MVNRAKVDWESEIGPMTKAAVGSGLKRPEDAWVTFDEDAESHYGAGHVYVKRFSPDNSEHTVTKIRPRMLLDVRDGLCVKIESIPEDVQGVAWELTDYGTHSFEQFGGQIPSTGISRHSHQTDSEGGTLDGAAIATGTIDDARLSANVVLLDGVQTFTGAKTFGSGDLIATDADLNTPDIDGGTIDTAAIAGSTIDSSGIGQTTPAAGRFTALALAAATELTISTDAVTVTQSYHRIDTESDAGSDDLVTINGGGDALNRVVLRAENTARTVVIKTTGNISTPDGADITLDDASITVELIYDGVLTKWLVIGVASAGIGSGSVDVTDGTTTVSPADTLNFDPAYFDISNAGGGQADVTLHAAGGTLMRVEVPLSTVTLGVDGTISFSSLPASGYSDLIVRVIAKTTAAVTKDGMQLILNGTTTATDNHTQVVSGENGTSSVGEGDTLTIANIPGASSEAAAWGYIDIAFKDYLSTTARKNVLMTEISEFAADNQAVSLRHRVWQNTSAITSIQLRTDNDPTDLLAAGSTATLYGIKNVAVGGGALPVSTANVSNPPTDAELDTEFGTPATVGAGYQAIVNDNNAGTNVYIITSDGANWWYAAMTKAV
jgi:hypothetical protein